MDLLASAAQQGTVGGVLHQSVFERVLGVRWRAPAKISSARVSCFKESSICGCGIVATALINSCENERPSAAPTWAISRVGASRSSRAKSEAWSDVGIASGVAGPVSS